MGHDEPTYRCSTCHDRTYLLHHAPPPDRMPYEPFVARVCPDCFGAPTEPVAPMAPTLEHLRLLPWWIALDGSRLVARRPDLPATWLYPDGRMCEYPPYRRLESTYPHVYASLASEARRLRRVHREEQAR